MFKPFPVRSHETTGYPKHSRCMKIVGAALLIDMVSGIDNEELLIITVCANDILCVSPKI
jgi:hypothetical protein